MPFVGLVPIEFVIRRKRPVALGQTCERAAALVSLGLDLDGAATCVNHDQLVAFNPSASTNALDDRTTRLLPHFETCIAVSTISIHHVHIIGRS